MPAGKIAIIGAGPIGLEAAMLARTQNFDVVVLDQSSVAGNIRSWGHVRLFSPFEMNSSEWGRAALNGLELPSRGDLLTGIEFRNRYLLPLSRHPLLEECIRENCQVVSIGRRQFWKGDAIGKPLRQTSPFQLLAESQANHEEIIEADYVFDCSGTFGNHNWLGAGGMPAIGERSLTGRIDYCLPDIAGGACDHFSGKRTLVVGSGYSAATAVIQLEKLRLQNDRTQVIWLTRRKSSTPLATINGDQLQGRAGLTRAANLLALESDNGVTWINGGLVYQLSVDHLDQIEVRLDVVSEQGDLDRKVLTVDHILANVGYRPDRSVYEELQIHECYASQGPIKLAAALLGESSSDCMAQSVPGNDTLTNPEPGFFILGAKSYGRDSRFLIRTGLQQIASALELIASEAK